MKIIKLKKIIPIVLVSLFFSCNSSSEQDVFLGKWVSTKDSISLPIEVYKTETNFFVKIPYQKTIKEFPANYDKDEKFLSIENVFKLYYLPDSNFIKLNVKGRSENFRRITDDEAKVRSQKYVSRLRSDSIKANNLKNSTPFKDYKNNDAEIFNRVLKRKKNLQ